jgi:hypothetical protein
MADAPNGDMTDGRKLATPGARRTRLFVTVGVFLGVAVVSVALFEFSNTSSTPTQINYSGHSYAGGAEVNRIEVTAHFGPLHRGRGTIDAKRVFVTAGTPPGAVALRLPNGNFDAYQLMNVP